MLTCYNLALTTPSKLESVNSANTASAKAVLEKMVEDHFDYLYAYAYRYFRSEEHAEDLVQETFLAATKALERFEGKSSARTWLTGILRHKILDKVRKKSREEPLDFQAMECDPLGKQFDQDEHWHAQTGPLIWGASPDGALGQKQFFTVLEACLSRLPAKVRQIFLLREMEGFDRDEICRQFELKSSNVGVILHRARISLQQCLQDHWFRGAPITEEQ